MSTSDNCSKVVNFLRFLFDRMGSKMESSGTIIFKDPEDTIFNNLVMCPLNKCANRWSVTHKSIVDKDIAKSYYQDSKKKKRWLLQGRKYSQVLDIHNWINLSSRGNLKQFEVKFNEITQADCVTPHQIKLLGKKIALLYQFQIRWSSNSVDNYTFLKLERVSFTSSPVQHSLSMSSHMVFTN